MANNAGSSYYRLILFSAPYPAAPNIEPVVSAYCWPIERVSQQSK
jgi:hypothetical protein